MVTFANSTATTTVVVPDMLVTTYLHMTHPSQFRPAYVNDPRLSIIPLNTSDVAFYRFLYSEVGRDWRWRDRLLMSDEELEAAISQPGVNVYVAYVDGAPAGYVELAQKDGVTEIAYFGLRPQYMGMGLGKHLLSFGIEQAWNNGAERVWVHTCNLDGPHALENYQKRGLSIYSVHEQPMPNRYA
jgi:ribosomal protein S18 acetylase RimI-like enzyme